MLWFPVQRSQQNHMDPWQNRGFGITIFSCMMLRAKREPCKKKSQSTTNQRRCGAFKLQNIIIIRKKRPDATHVNALFVSQAVYFSGLTSKVVPLRAVMYYHVGIKLPPPLPRSSGTPLYPSTRPVFSFFVSSPLLAFKIPFQFSLRLGFFRSLLPVV